MEGRAWFLRRICSGRVCNWGGRSLPAENKEHSRVQNKLSSPLLWDLALLLVWTSNGSLEFTECNPQNTHVTVLTQKLENLAEPLPSCSLTALTGGKKEVIWKHISTSTASELKSSVQSVFFLPLENFSVFLRPVEKWLCLPPEAEPKSREAL